MSRSPPYHVVFDMSVLERGGRNMYMCGYDLTEETGTIVSFKINFFPSAVSDIMLLF